MTDVVDALIALGITDEFVVDSDVTTEEHYKKSFKDLTDQNRFIEWSIVKNKIDSLQADFNAKKYQRDRALVYPSIQDVVVALAEKEEGDDTMWKEITAQRAKVKSDNPKPS